MPIHPNAKQCRHLKVNGTQCGSPALRGEQFCYFHQRMIRGVRTPFRSRIHPAAMLEDEESIQASLMEVVNALIRNTIDYRRADLIIRALHIAVKNIRRARFNPNSQMVREVPDYGDVGPGQAAEAVADAQDATFNYRDAIQSGRRRYLDEAVQGLKPQFAKPQPQDRFTESADLAPQPQDAASSKAPAAVPQTPRLSFGPETAYGSLAQTASDPKRKKGATSEKHSQRTRAASSGAE